MTVQDLRKAGAIYIENVVDGMKRYENHTVFMDQNEACEKFVKLWKMNGFQGVYVDFYYGRIPAEAREKVKEVLSPQELQYIQNMRPAEEEIIFPADETLISICTKLNAEGMLFSTFYITGEQKSTWWGNYEREYIVFTEKEISA